jgi:hypothetical protein
MSAPCPTPDAVCQKQIVHTSGVGYHGIRQDVTTTNVMCWSLPESCNRNYSSKQDGITITINTTCCDSDYCNEPPPCAAGGGGGGGGSGGGGGGGSSAGVDAMAVLLAAGAAGGVWAYARQRRAQQARQGGRLAGADAGVKASLGTPLLV